MEANRYLTACVWQSPCANKADLDLRLFLMSDAVTAGLRGQKPAEGYNIQQMLEILTAQNVPVKLCKTCTDGRGITTLPLIDGVAVGTLVELAQWTLAADESINLLITASGKLTESVDNFRI